MIPRLPSFNFNLHLNLVAHRGLVIAVVVIGLWVFVHFSATREGGALYRAGVAFEDRLEGQLRSMFVARPRERASQISWLIVCVSISCLMLRAFVPVNALVVASILVIIIPPILVSAMVTKRLRRVSGQVPGYALALANALKTTASIIDALHVTTNVTAAPLKQELETALKEMRIGSTLEDALLAMASRAKSAPLDIVVSALLIGRQTGGDLPRILEQTAGSLRELRRLEEMTAKTTRGARGALAMAAALTVAIAIAMAHFMPGFLDPLFTTVKGQVVMAQCAIAYVFALYLGYRFTRVSV